jgi:2-methylcitrate dehydratase PrpD
VVALRRKVEVVADESLRKDEARAHLRLQNGRSFDTHIPHDSGTVDNPMSDQAIEAKFLANATPILGADGARRFADMCWALEQIDDANKLADALA